MTDPPLIVFKFDSGRVANVGSSAGAGAGADVGGRGVTLPVVRSSACGCVAPEDRVGMVWCSGSTEVCN
jgi:hypothetical protein